MLSALTLTFQARRERLWSKTDVLPYVFRVETLKELGKHSDCELGVVRVTLVPRYTSVSDYT
jgi:hypothetical protein